MSVTERLMLPGSWNLNLSPDTPQSILDRLDLDAAAFGHVIITPTHIGPVEQTGFDLLAVSRYTGILRNRPSQFEMSGAGLPAWLGDEDGKGDVIEAPLAKVSGSFSDWVVDLIPASLTAGTITAIAGAFTQTFRHISRREALDHVADHFSAEWRINPDGTLDAGLEADLFVTSPSVVVQRLSGGRDLNVTGMYGDVAVARDVDDFTTRVVLIAEHGVGVANISPAPAWLDLNGNVVEQTRLIESTETKRENRNVAAQAQLNRFTKQRRSIMLSSDQFDIAGDVAVGDTIWVYDPEQGLFDTGNEVAYRGQTIHPIEIRVLGYDWPVQAGMGVYFRAPDAAGTITDLTEWVEWDTGTTKIEIGATARRAVDDTIVTSVSTPNQPRSRVVATRTTDQNISDNTPTTVRADITDTDDLDDYDIATWTFTAPEAGYYDLAANVVWDTNTTGRRQAWFEVNGAGFLGLSVLQAVVNTGSVVVADDVRLAAGDTVVLRVFQNSGAARTLASASFPARVTYGRAT